MSELLLTRPRPDGARLHGLLPGSTQHLQLVSVAPAAPALGAPAAWPIDAMCKPMAEGRGVDDVNGRFTNPRTTPGSLDDLT
jgi:hypothetical protein